MLGKGVGTWQHWRSPSIYSKSCSARRLYAHMRYSFCLFLERGTLSNCLPDQLFLFRFEEGISAVYIFLDPPLITTHRFILTFSLRGKTLPLLFPLLSDSLVVVKLHLMSSSSKPAAGIFFCAISQVCFQMYFLIRCKHRYNIV